MSMRFKYSTWLVAFFMMAIAGSAQSFQSAGSTIGYSLLHSGTMGGNGISMADFNQDGWDDISIGLPASNPGFFINNQGNFESVELGITNDTEGDVKMVLWADYDNDGDQDCFFTVDDSSVKLFNNDGEMNFTDVTELAGILNESVYHFGAAFGDYNNDGWLDLFVCKYEGIGDADTYENKNHLYENNQDGTFTDVSLAAGIADVQYLSFQAGFLDYNEDGWQDIYVINDKFAHPNEMYLNNGDGTFSNTAVATNTSLTIDAMSVAVADFDNDEHQDIYVTNTLGGNSLLKNLGNGFFSDVASSAGVGMNLISWGAIWIDYDNDKLQDLYVATATNVNTSLDQNQFFRNSGGISFSALHESIGLAADERTTYGVAAGDINNDGYPDFAQNNISPFPCDAYLNTGGPNNWLKVSLEGVASNRDGIGSWIKAYVGDVVMTRYMHAGEGYLQQDSRRKMFGLGQATQVDSLEVIWLSGIVDKIYDVPANVGVHMTEGQTLGNIITYQGDTEFCEGGSLELFAGNWTEYLWNTGEITPSITVDEAGDYWVETINNQGIEVMSDTVTITIIPPPLVEVVSITDVTCAGGEDGTIQIFNTSGTGSAEVWWDGVETGIPLLPNANAGTHTWTLVDQNGCSASGEAEVNEPPAIVATLDTTWVTCFGGSDGSVIISLTGGTGELSLDDLGLDFNQLAAGEYIFLAMDDAGCVVEVPVTIDQPEELIIDISIAFDPKFGGGTVVADISGGTGAYDIVWSTGEEGVTEIVGVEEGEYTVTVTDANGCVTTHTFTVVGVGDLNASPIIIWPNPTSEKINIKGHSANSIVDIRNLSGLLVIQQNLSVRDHIDLSHLETGVYLLEIRSEGASYSSTIIKQ